MMMVMMKVMMMMIDKNSNDGDLLWSTCHVQHIIVELLPSAVLKGCGSAYEAIWRSKDPPPIDDNSDDDDSDDDDDDDHDDVYDSDDDYYDDDSDYDDKWCISSSPS